MKRIYSRPYKPLAVTYFDLKHYTFTAKGKAGRQYTIINVSPGQCLLQRLIDGFRFYMDTGRVLAIVNGNI